MARKQQTLSFCTGVMEIYLYTHITMCFEDLEKACDHVPQHLFWELLQEYGVYGSMPCVIQSLYECSENCVSILALVKLVYGSTPVCCFHGHDIRMQLMLSSL